MKSRARFPIRLKILISLLFVVTAVVSVITFTMANLFHDDKRAYIHDLSSIVALSTAEECRSILKSYAERLKVYAAVMDREGLAQSEKIDLLKDFFKDFPELVAVLLVRDGEERAAAYNAALLDRAGTTKAELQKRLFDEQIEFARIAGADDFTVRNLSPNRALPSMLMTVAMPGTEGSQGWTIAAVVRLDSMMKLALRSNAFEVYLLDDRGMLLAHPNVEQVVQRQKVDLASDLDLLQNQLAASVTLEYEDAGREMVGGFAPVGYGGIVAAAQIPQSAAYLAARQLLDRLLIVALALLIVATLAGLVWSHRVTKPMTRLSAATRRIGRGEFHVQVAVDSRDEIGDLAGSFNQMTSELRDRDEALRTAQAQLVQSEKMAAFGQLGAGIAHEVKNPLAGILGCAQLGLRKAEPGTPVRKNLELIEKETKRCKAIIENLLKFARQEKAVFEPVHVNQVANDAIAIVNHQLELNQVKLERDLSDHLPMVHGNGNQLQQVLMNLMINAQQAMEGSSGTVRLSSRVTDSGQVELEVCDDGPGIPDDVKAKLFEPFFTTKPGGKGTGLGLSVSFGIVEDHQGEIKVDSELGKGSRFVITLPALQLKRPGVEQSA